MTTKRESILVALLAHLMATAPSLTFARNPALKEMVDGKTIALRDGGIELTEEFINGPIYEFTMSPIVTVVFEKDDGDIDAEIDAAVSLVAAGVATASDLGGLVEDIRPQPPEMAVQEVFGSPDLKGAEITIEIDFWTNSRIG